MPMPEITAKLAIVFLAGVLQPNPAPVPYPRPGTTKLFENERVLVWDVAWLRQQYPLHTHLYDAIGISYFGGDRVIAQQDGTRRLQYTPAWTTMQQRAGVTHVEEGASDPPFRGVVIEIKDPKARGTGTVVTLGPPPMFENDRAVVWGYGPGLSPTDSPHDHLRDAVEVSFKGQHPSVRFVAAGATHSIGDASNERTFVVALK